jgi:putative oxidoreductase
MRSITMSKAVTHTATSTSSRALNIGLWVLQTLLAALFLWHGQFMVFPLMVFPPADMVAMINANMGSGLRVFIGVAEILAAVGLILPGLTRILPFLIALAAAGLMIVMASASLFHLYRGETASAISAAVILLLVSVVAYTRWKVSPIRPRNRA